MTVSYVTRVADVICYLSHGFKIYASLYGGM